MKKMLLLSAALIAAMAGPAMAQREGGAVGNGSRAREAAPQSQQAYPDRGGRTGGYTRGNDGGVTRADQLPQVQQRAPAPQAQQAQRDGRDFNRGSNDNRRDFNRGSNDNRRDFNRGDRDGRPDFNRGGNDNRPGFGRNDNNRRYDNNRGYDNRRFSQYYRNWNSPNRFRAGAYYRPQGFSYRRWNYGDILPSVFWGSRYWLNNYNTYDLPPPPPGTIWVRYGDDALLIDRYSGEVIQVSYSVFW